MRVNVRVSRSCVHHFPLSCVSGSSANFLRTTNRSSWLAVVSSFSQTQEHNKDHPWPMENLAKKKCLEHSARSGSHQKRTARCPRRSGGGVPPQFLESNHNCGGWGRSQISLRGHPVRCS